MTTPVRAADAGTEPAVASVRVSVATLLVITAPAGLKMTWIEQVASDASGTTHLL
jgi:hypothetical protein